MGHGEFSDDTIRYTSLYFGTVVDNQDPDILGRVRVMVPGLIEPASAWALPIGTAGGGSAQRGTYAVPELHATVAVWFLMGDPDRPVYLAGHWGKPDGTSEIPTPIQGLAKDQAPLVQATETKRFLIVLDNRSGNEQLIIKDKANAASIVRLAGGKVYVGDTAADQPFVRGADWKTMMEALIDAILAITVPTGVGPSGPPMNAATFTSIKSALSSKLSTIVFGK